MTNAGGLGGLGMWGRRPEQAERRNAGFRCKPAVGTNYYTPGQSRTVEEAVDTRDVVRKGEGTGIFMRMGIGVAWIV